MDLSSSIEIERISSTAPSQHEKGFGRQKVEHTKATSDVEQVNPEELEKLSNEYAAAVNQAYGHKIQFDIGKDSGSVSSIHFKVIDRQTGKILHEFPPDKVANLAKNSASNLGQGLLVDESA